MAAATQPLVGECACNVHALYIHTTFFYESLASLPEDLELSFLKVC
jgi:hypothetical protein